MPRPSHRQPFLPPGPTPRCPASRKHYKAHPKAKHRAEETERAAAGPQDVDSLGWERTSETTDSCTKGAGGGSRQQVMCAEMEILGEDILKIKTKTVIKMVKKGFEECISKSILN